MFVIAVMTHSNIFAIALTGEGVEGAVAGRHRGAV